jgi:integrase
MAHRLANGTWRVLIRRKGHPTIDRTFATAKEAAEFESQQRTLLDQARSLWSPSMTLEEATRQYLASTLFSQKTAHTQTTERTRLKNVLAALGKFSLSQLENGQRISAYRDDSARRISERTGKRVSPDSVRLELAALSAVFHWAVENRILVRNPLIGMRRPHGQPRRRRLFEHEEINLVATMFDKRATEELKQAARFLVIQRELGCRPGELATLRRDDIDAAARAARFRDTKHKREDRIVHLTDNAVKAITQQLAHARVSAPDSPFLFSSRSRYGGVPLPASFARYVKLLRAEKVVDVDLHAHAVRREYVSNAFENGLSHADVMRMTGHRSYAAVQTYNRSQNLHPEVRKRLDREATKRKEQLFRAFADALEITPDELRGFLTAHRALGEAAPDFERRQAAAKPGQTAAAASKPKRVGRGRGSGGNGACDADARE